MLHCIFTAAYFIFVENSCAIIIVLFESIFRVTVVKTVLQSMPQLLHVYLAYLPYLFTLPVLDSTQLTSLLDMKGDGDEDQPHSLVMLCLVYCCQIATGIKEVYCCVEVLCLCIKKLCNFCSTIKKYAAW